MKTVALRRTLSAAALVALGVGLLAVPASADPNIPETPEQSRILGDASRTAEVTAEDESQGSLAPGNIPFLPMDFSYTPLKKDQEESTAKLELVKNVPIQDGQATMSNLAFKGDYVFQGSYNGFVAYDISNPEDPQVVSNTICPGYQGDLSIAGDLLFFSVDQPRNGSACGAGTIAASNADAWEGIRIFDISDPAAPQYVGNVKTRCGSHTHTLVPNPNDEGSVYLYNAAYDVSASAFNCKPPHQQLEIIKVDLDDPAGAAIVKEVVLWDADNPAFTTADRADGGASTSATNGCHDLTAYPAKGLLAAACMGDGVMLDISDPLTPKVTDRVRDENYAFWHTAQFNDDASKVVWQDELGGGSSATCLPGTPQYRGANAIYTIEDEDLSLKGYYKIPRRQSTRENCVGHEGNIVQVADKDIMVQAWYQGGASLIDFTSASKPKEIGYFDRGPISETSLVTGGYWAVYVHNGYVYGSEIARGLDVMKLKGDEFADARRHRQDVRNPATQEPISYPWKTAPKASGTLPAASVSPASVPAGAATDVTVSLPADTFTSGEYVDVWSGSKVVASGQAAANGSVELTVPVAATEKAGTKSLVVRGDSKLDAALYSASVELTAVSTTTSVKLSRTSQVFGSTPATVTATVSGAGAQGTVTFRAGSTVLKAGVPVKGGKATLTLSKTLAVKTYAIRAEFVPSSTATTGSTSSAVTLKVVKATAKVKVSAKKVKASARAKVTVTVSAKGTTPTGKVTVKVNGKSVKGTLKKGKVTVTLPKLKAGKHTVKVTYAGSAKVAGKSTKTTIRVTK
ncbi:Ig-like domain repeat protein [Aeromicrobium duanguangcaii]|uniref:Ig-like domain repeat protein n=1 Tax=Aeromicrobium duanguangcaii TaxID=2968086 RepID=A0ABY5KCD3_9ACTN|nr:Ig-like domain repeat protein [Aeromicrobium duanguangcaii]UUI67428.1 Ig-like domain repeat protein [Aeromicrobium duanguangcaii]